MKKIVSVFLAFMIVASMFSAVTITASAYSVPDEAGFAAKLNSLRAQFPNGGYYSGTYYENGTAKAWECHGYALECFEQVFGIQYYNSGFYNRRDYTMGTIYAGDIVRTSNDGHTIFITKVEGDRIYFTDANYWSARYGANRVRWDVCFTYSQLAAEFTYKVHVPENYLTGKPGPSFTPADIGTDFYGSIVNLAVNKPIKEAGGNVVCGVRNGSDEQKWRFERQGDMSYKIINAHNGECLEVAGAGTTDNSNIRTYPSNDTPAQRWFFRNNGSGYSLVPCCAKNLALDLVNGTSNEGDNIAAWTFVEGNGNQIYGIDRQPSFTPADIDTNFYGSIVNLVSNKPIKVSDNNVVMGIRNGSNEQKWKFERMDDRMYKITNVSNGLCLEIAGAGITDNSNIRTYPSNDTPAQRWYLRWNGSGYSLVSKCAHNLAMDMVNGDSSEGNNIAAWTFVEGNGNQIFGIDIQPSFEPQDLGDSFTAYIVHSSSGSVVTENIDHNIVINKNIGSNTQLWLFTRMDDRMYKITNYSTGRVLDIDNGGITDDTNIHTWSSADNTHQRWYLWKNGSGYSFVPKCSMNLAMDLVGGNTADGSNLAAWTCVSENSNQIFSLNFYVEEKQLLGDVDGDNQITIMDATLIQHMLANMKKIDSFNETAADADENGNIEITDATFIQRYEAQIATPYKIGEPIE